MFLSFENAQNITTVLINRSRFISIFIEITFWHMLTQLFHSMAFITLLKKLIRLSICIQILTFFFQWAQAFLTEIRVDRTNFIFFLEITRIFFYLLTNLLPSGLIVFLFLLAQKIAAFKSWGKRFDSGSDTLSST